jgi:hypothetical protein
VDLENVNIDEEETLLRHVLCIVLKFFESTNEGMLTIKIENFVIMSAEILMNCSAKDLQNMDKKFVNYWIMKRIIKLIKK